MEIIIYIYNGMTMLDAIGPYEVLRNLDHAKIKLVAKNKGEIVADSRCVHLNAKYEIAEIKKADILIVPGSTIGFIREAKDQKVLRWIKEINETTQKTVSVCSGSVILAAAGLLEDKKATSHWKAVTMLAEYRAIPCRERIVEEGKFITAAGVSAGIDMALYLVHQLAGKQAAKAAQLIIEYDPEPPFDSGNFLTASPETIGLAEQLLEREVKKELSWWDMIKHAKTLLKMR